MSESTGSNAEILESTRQFCKAGNDEGLKCNKETWTNGSMTLGPIRKRHVYQWKQDKWHIFAYK